MILNDIILHDSQEFAAALALQAQSKKKGDRKKEGKEGRKKEGRKNATGKKKVISDDTE